MNVPDKGYSRNVPDEGYSRNVHDEGYSRNVPDEGYSRNIPDEGYSRNVPDEGYSRNASCALKYKSIFVLLSLGRYICWWTISLLMYSLLQHGYGLLDIFMLENYSS